VRFEDLGEIRYQEALKRQEELVDQVASGAQPETVIFCSHPPVVTLGRATQPGDVFHWQGEVVQVSRGGRATYHGPNQLVIYPILDLRTERAGLPARDVHAYLRFLESLVVQALAKLDIQAEVRTHKNDDGTSLTGVWVHDKKVASIGIAVRQWITYHGIAINLVPDKNAFSGINPCGFSQSTMTSLKEVAPRLSDISYENLRKTLTENIKLLINKV
jgi:lipoate-protein ligase B